MPCRWKVQIKFDRLIEKLIIFSGNLFHHNKSDVKKHVNMYCNMVKTQILLLNKTNQKQKI